MPPSDNSGTSAGHGSWFSRTKWMSLFRNKRNRKSMKKDKKADDDGQNGAAVLSETAMLNGTDGDISVVQSADVSIDKTAEIRTEEKNKQKEENLIEATDLINSNDEQLTNKQDETIRTMKVTDDAADVKPNKVSRRLSVHRFFRGLSIRMPKVRRKSDQKNVDNNELQSPGGEKSIPFADDTLENEKHTINLKRSSSLSKEEVKKRWFLHNPDNTSESVVYGSNKTATLPISSPVRCEKLSSGSPQGFDSMGDNVFDRSNGRTQSLYGGRPLLAERGGYKLRPTLSNKTSSSSDHDGHREFLKNARNSLKHFETTGTSYTSCTTHVYLNSGSSASQNRVFPNIITTNRDGQLDTNVSSLQYAVNQEPSHVVNTMNGKCSSSNSEDEVAGGKLTEETGDVSVLSSQLNDIREDNKNTSCEMEKNGLPTSSSNLNSEPATANTGINAMTAVLDENQQSEVAPAVEIVANANVHAASDSSSSSESSSDSEDGDAFEQQTEDPVVSTQLDDIRHPEENSSDEMEKVILPKSDNSNSSSSSSDDEISEVTTYIVEESVIDTRVMEFTTHGNPVLSTTPNGINTQSSSFEFPHESDPKPDTADSKPNENPLEHCLVQNDEDMLVTNTVNSERDTQTIEKSRDVYSDENVDGVESTTIWNPHVITPAIVSDNQFDTVPKLQTNTSSSDSSSSRSSESSSSDSEDDVAGDGVNEPVDGFPVAPTQVKQQSFSFNPTSDEMKKNDSPKSDRNNSLSFSLGGEVAAATTDINTMDLVLDVNNRPKDASVVNVDDNVSNSSSSNSSESALSQSEDDVAGERQARATDSVPVASTQLDDT